MTNQRDVAAILLKIMYFLIKQTSRIIMELYLLTKLIKNLNKTTKYYFLIIKNLILIIQRPTLTLNKFNFGKEQMKMPMDI